MGDQHSIPGTPAAGIWRVPPRWWVATYCFEQHENKAILLEAAFQPRCPDWVWHCAHGGSAMPLSHRWKLGPRCSIFQSAYQALGYCSHRNPVRTVRSAVSAQRGVGQKHRQDCFADCFSVALFPLLQCARAPWFRRRLHDGVRDIFCGFLFSGHNFVRVRYHPAFWCCGWVVDCIEERNGNGGVSFSGGIRSRPRRYRNRRVVDVSVFLYEF